MRFQNNHGAPARFLLCRLSALAFLICLLTGTANATIRMVSADDNRITFEVEIEGHRFTPSAYAEGTEDLSVPGFGTFSGPGAPALPGRTFLVAIPPNHTYSLSYSVLESEALGSHRITPVPFSVVERDDNGLPTASVEYRFDPEAYDAGGASFGVSAGPEGRMRFQRVLPVRVVPVTYDPASGNTILATRIRIDISLRRDRAGTPAAAPVVESGTWERIYSRTLVNPVRAREWRTRPSAPAVRFDEKAYAAAAGPLVKLAVRANTLHRVRASGVIAKGFPPGTPVGQLHVFKRYYDETSMSEQVTDVAFKVVEDAAGIAGEFDGNDVLIFYGQRLMDDPLQGDDREKFSDHNIYWLGATGGPVMNEKVVSAAPVRPDTATVSFPVTAYFEEDHYFVEETPPGVRDFNYFNNYFNSDFTQPFTIGAVDQSSTFRLRARLMGVAFARPGVDPPDRFIQVSLLNGFGTTALPDVNVPNKDIVDYDSGPISAATLASGLNRVRIDGVNPGALAMVMNYFSIEYDSPFRTVGNVLEFNTSTLTGVQGITVVGLNRSDVMLFDISDPYAPEHCVLSASNFTDVGNGYALSFGGTFTANDRFVVTPLDRIHEITGTDIIADEPSTLIGNPLENGIDALVVAHADYVSEMQRWVSYRRAQGYRVMLADVQDVYDEFSGGVPNARAIRRLTDRLFRMGGLSYLLLVGDASEDQKRVHSDSAPNFVPTESFSERVVSTFFNEDEVVTTDKWYGMLTGEDIIYGNPSPITDYFQDVIVGRLPAGNQNELRIMLDKIFEFESPEAGDFWRRRMIRLADDEWSGGNLVCDRNEPFQSAEEQSAQIIENSLPGGFDVVRFFLQDRISHPSGVICPGVSVWSQCQVTRADASPVLRSELNQGATFVSINAHMNRFQICHEWLFTSYVTALGERTPDPDRLQNQDKPFIVFGMGCHMSDYAVHRESVRTAQNPPNGDCLSEELMILDGKGAVAVYASTGFEYLSENLNYTRAITEMFFETPPSAPVAPDNRRQVRWILGEVMAMAEIDNLQRFPGFSGLGSRGQAKRYHILGDPMLHIDAGPPRFDVTVDGNPVESGDVVFAGSLQDTIDVRAVVSDELAIEGLRLTIDGVDETSAMTVTPLVDQGFDAARRYEVTFKHRVRPETYDIVLEAQQAPDTTGTGYHMAAQFVLKVQLDVELTVDGRPIVQGDFCPANGDFVFRLGFPVEIDPALIRAEVDGDAVTDLALTHPSAQETKVWLASFTRNLGAGAHRVSVFVDNREFAYSVNVGNQYGLRDLFAYPNPYVKDTYFVFNNDVEITNGSIEIFTTSGKRIASLDIPSEARQVGQNAVYWNGRTASGGTVANGVYLYVVKVQQGNRSSTHRGKLVQAR